MNDPEAVLLDRLTLAPLPGSEADLLLAAHPGRRQACRYRRRASTSPAGRPGVYRALLASVFGDSVSATQGADERNFQL